MKPFIILLAASMTSAFAADFTAKPSTTVNLTSSDRLIFPNDLRDGNGDGFVSSSTVNAQGKYSFNFVAADGTSRVQFVNTSVLKRLAPKTYGLKSYVAPQPPTPTPPPVNPPTTGSVKSEMLSTEIFLQGNYLSLGFNRDGGIGSRQAAPAGHESEVSGGYLRVGLYADMDGLDAGAESTIRDLVLNGRAIEGFSVGYKVSGVYKKHINASLTGFSQIPGVTKNESTSTLGKASWVGSTPEGLKISQKISLTANAKYVIVDVALTNTSSVAMNELRYLRSMDADHGPANQYGTEGFITLNKINLQGPGPSLVTAAMPDGKFPSFIYTKDTSSKASIYGFTELDPALPVFDSQALGYTSKSDTTVRMLIKAGTLNPGATRHIRLFIGLTDNLEKTLAEINAL